MERIEETKHHQYIRSSHLFSCAGMIDMVMRDGGWGRRNAGAGDLACSPGLCRSTGTGVGLRCLRRAIVEDTSSDAQANWESG